MNTLLITSGDKISCRLHRHLGELPSLRRYFDQSSTPSRVLRLVRRGSLKPRWVLSMLWADFRRANEPVPALPAIRTNRELADLIRQEQIQTLYLFRAGLIINKTVLKTGARLLNCHCCRLPDYGGLGAIPRALEANDLAQNATLHVVTDEIDKGEIIETVGYNLDPKLSYRSNEDIAYDAGIKLLANRLKGKFSV